MALINIASSQRTILLPENIKERAQQWVQTQPSGPHRTPRDAPFRRMIDFWFASIAWAVENNIPAVTVAEGTKFVSIGPTPQDVRLQDWKLDLLVLIAVRDFGHEDVRSQQPLPIIDLANRYAEAGGEPLLRDLDSVEEFAVPKLYRVTDLLVDRFDKAALSRRATY